MVLHSRSGRPRRLQQAWQAQGARYRRQGWQDRRPRHQGQRSQHGSVGFEGGQMPLIQRVPKLRGFTNPFRVEYQAINLDTIAESDSPRSPRKACLLVVLCPRARSSSSAGRGELGSAVTVKATPSRSRRRKRSPAPAARLKSCRSRSGFARRTAATTSTPADDPRRVPRGARSGLRLAREPMLQRVLNMFRVADLRQILFSLMIIAIYRPTFVPAPGSMSSSPAMRDQANQGGILGFVQLFSGGALTQFSVFALGIMPYITASIIMQILGVVIPKVEQWQQQGDRSAQDHPMDPLPDDLDRRGAVDLVCVLVPQRWLGRHDRPPAGVQRLDRLRRGLTLTTGTALLMWMGGSSPNGIGNGMSLLIFTSVVSTLPAQGSLVQAGNGNVALIILILVAVALLVGIVFVEQGRRRIPVQFAKRVVQAMYGPSTYIPLKVNQSGVIPIIFASSVLYLPTLVATALPSTGFWGSIQEWVDGNLVDPTSPVYLAFFGDDRRLRLRYTAISVTRPSRPTPSASRVASSPVSARPSDRALPGPHLSRITFPSAMFIAAVALVPSILIAVTIGTDSSSGAGAGAGGFAFGGISLLIATGVALDDEQIDGNW